MQPSSTCLTLMVLVDALRPDYVSRMPYLRDLSGGGAVGRLRECFGFVPRAAYFGGLNAETFGFTNMFSFDPENSPFSMARYLPSSSQGAVVEKQVGLRTAVESSARERLGSFAKAYAASAEIPMDFLPYFDLVERRAPWDPHTGYTSLFSKLDEAGLPWHECSWPGTNRLDDASDDGIVRQVLKDLESRHRFSYVHLQQLDGNGHVHGPQSAAMHEQIAAMDTRLQLLIETLRSRYDRLNLLLFGDHGMVNVTRTLDAWEILRGLDLEFGIDYAYFLDSSMVRFWFYRQGARDLVEKTFAQVAGGRLLKADDLESLGIAGCDSRNAELIFLADPGVLVFPNFFQGHGDPIKGMHGYDPDCPDNLGFFMMQSPAWPQLNGKDVGKVDPAQLYHLLNQFLELPGQSEIDSLVETAVSAKPGRFTMSADPESDRMIGEQLQIITDSVRERLGDYESIILTGSFGRGEGGVYRDASGQLRPINDYDLLVVASRPPAEDPSQLGRELAQKLGIDYVDLGWIEHGLESLPLTVSHYDLKHGSQVIAGQPDVLDRLPDFSAAEMPVYEAVKLLLNRSAGILSGLSGAFMTGKTPDRDESFYLVNQIIKARMARGDWHLIRWQGYDSSYRLRGERFASLAPGAGLDVGEVDEICLAYQHKCDPDYHHYRDPLGDVKRLQEQLVPDLIHSISLLTETGLGNLTQALERYLCFMSSDAGMRRAENGLAMAHAELSTQLKGGPDPDISYRHLIYAVVPLVLSSYDIDPGKDSQKVGMYREANRLLTRSMDWPDPGPWTPENWEKLRSHVVQSWFALCH